ncbi:MAG: hypothetical protein JWO24_1708 [Rhodospirillales bacterium]|jgi:hypothetical protein|nr:hypothetical protein [Rhodospirillales bacterium]
MTDLALATSPLLSATALGEIRAAFETLEKTSLAARLAALAGTPLEALRNALPNFVQSRLDGAVRAALERAMTTALGTRPETAPFAMNQAWFHRGLAAVTGMAGGAFGLPGTLVELPISTTLLLRQIAAEAAAEGEELTDPGTPAECLKVFALGGRGTQDDAAESGYFAVRVALAETLKGTVGVNLLPGFIGAIAARFGGPVALKLGAQAAPILGAAAGAAVNLAFLQHFRAIAKAHFTLRRLERNHGDAAVRAAYDAIAAGRDARFAG